MFSEGTDVSSVAEVVKKLPQPTGEHNLLFVFVQKLLEAAALSQRMSIASNVADCAAAYELLANIIDQWPLCQVGSARVVYEELGEVGA